MDKLGIILALVALGVAGLAFAQVGEKDARIAELTQGNSDLKDQLTTLEVKLDAALGLEDPATPMGASAPASAEDGAASEVGLATRAPTSPLARLAELEKTVKRQNELLAKLESSDKGADDAAGMVRSFMPKNFFHNTDAAAKALALDERQKAEMEDILERAKGELKDLYAIENDEGVTWDQVRKPKMANLGGEGGSISIAMPDWGKIQKFKQGRIPGSSETFGAAEKRIRERAFSDVRRNLPADKAKTWDKAHKEPLLRGGGNGFAVSSIMLGTDAK